MTEQAKPEIRIAQCAKCGGSRNCDILGHHRQTGSDSYMSWEENWYTLRCRGCDYTFFQNSSNNSEDYDHYYDEHGDEQVVHHETDFYWPALLKRKRPEWLKDVGEISDDSSALHDALSELYGALDNDLVTLSAIGVRTAFDVAAELLGVNPTKTFAEKLDALVANGHIGIVDRERIETLVDAGSASAHRGWKPTKDDLEVMMDVLEHFIEAAFVGPQRRKSLDERAAAIKSRVPKRKKMKANVADSGSTELSSEPA